jgi:hypothetical protein
MDVPGDMEISLPAKEEAKVINDDHKELGLQNIQIMSISKEGGKIMYNCIMPSA